MNRIITKSFALFVSGTETPSNAYYHYYEYPDWYKVQPHYGIRSSTHKLIHFYTTNEWELFDLEQDPVEMQNQYLNPEYNVIVKEMKDRLQKERIAVGDTVILEATSKYHR